MPQPEKPVLITAVAGTTANSYVTEAFADTYFGDKLEWDDWTMFSDAKRCRALVSATANIDQEVAGFGGRLAKFDPVDPEQALMFPRAGDYADTGSLEIPDGVEESACLLALHILMRRAGALGPVDVASMQDAGVTSVSTAGLTVSIDVRWSQWPRAIRRLMNPYIERGAKGFAGRNVRKRRWHEGWIATGSD